MNVGPGGGCEEADVMVEINTTPLIDVMLVLLMMLIITIPIQLHSVNLNMPVGTPRRRPRNRRSITVDVDFDGTIYWNGDIVREQAGPRGADDRGFRAPVQPEMHLRPNKLAEYKDVAVRHGVGPATRRGEARPGRKRAIRR